MALSNDELINNMKTIKSAEYIEKYKFLLGYIELNYELVRFLQNDVLMFYQPLNRFRLEKVAR